MEVEVRYFAMIREIVGCAVERRQLPEGATAGELFERIASEHPLLERIRPVTMFMVNRAYVAGGQPLRDGDEVAFIPPVSGGESPRYLVQSEPLDAAALERLIAHPGAGAIVTFTGTVRDHGRGRPVTLLEYEAYEPAAELALAQIGDEIRERWGIAQVAIAHRVGSLAVGEASVVIAVAAAHRDAAFAACRYAIERIKEFVPIWKKEHYADGATWIGSERDYQVEIGRLAADAERTTGALSKIDQKL